MKELRIRNIRYIYCMKPLKPNHTNIRIVAIVIAYSNHEGNRLSNAGIAIRHPNSVRIISIAASAGTALSNEKNGKKYHAGFVSGNAVIGKELSAGIKELPSRIGDML